MHSDIVFWFCFGLVFFVVVCFGVFCLFVCIWFWFFVKYQDQKLNVSSRSMALRREAAVGTGLRAVLNCCVCRALGFELLDLLSGAGSESATTWLPWVVSELSFLRSWVWGGCRTVLWGQKGPGAFSPLCHSSLNVDLV